MQDCGRAKRGLPAESRRHDQAYKAQFSHPLAVRDLLRAFVAERLERGREWVRCLDFCTLEPLPTERIDPTLPSWASDLVWRVRFKDAADSPRWLHVLLPEFQSSVDWFMVLRVQGFVVRLRRWWNWWERARGRKRGRPHRGRRSRARATCWSMWASTG